MRFNMIGNEKKKTELEAMTFALKTPSIPLSQQTTKRIFKIMVRITFKRLKIINGPARSSDLSISIGRFHIESKNRITDK